MVGVRFNSLPNDNCLKWSKLKVFADNKLNATKKILKFVSGTIENIVGKGKKCWLPAFSPIPTTFSKDFLCVCVWGGGGFR